MMRLLPFLLASVAWAQLEGPTSGYIFDQASRELRPIRGIAGAAYLGSALIKDADLVSVSADGSLAAVARQGRIELVRGFDGPAPSRAVLVEDAGRVTFVWSGAALAAVNPAARQAFAWRDAKLAPAGLQQFDLAGLEGDLRALALDGDNLLMAATGGLYLAKSGSPLRRLETLADPAALLAVNGDLYVADRGANQVLHVRGYASGETSSRTFAALAQPVGLQLAKRNLLVASAHSRSVEIFDLATGARTGALDLDVAPTRLERVGSRSLALLNESSSEEPLFVLDYRDALAAFFVPAGREQ